MISAPVGAEQAPLALSTPRGIRQISVQARLFDSLLAGINNFWLSDISVTFVFYNSLVKKLYMAKKIGLPVIFWKEHIQYECFADH